MGIVFGGLVALDDVNMTVEKGQIRGLIGPNGSGKTTLINVISGFYQPTSGEVIFNGKKISSLPPHVISQTGLCRTFQNINRVPEMTALENITTAYSVHCSYNMIDSILKTRNFKKHEQVAREVALQQLEFVGLADSRDVKAKNLPYGKRRLLEIARLLATDPQLVLLDEPVAGMNEQESESVAKIVKKMQLEGNRTILLIEHDMKFVMGICDAITVLNSGKVIAEGTPDGIRNNPEVIACYLGKRR